MDSKLTAASNLDAVNQDFRRFDQVEKPQHYRLSESGEAEEFDDDFQIRTVDMADFFHGGEAGKARFADALGQALEDIGFAVLVGHGVDADLLTRTEREVARFFAEIAEPERQPYLAKRFGSVNQGYFPIERTTIIFPDQVEGWVFCRRAFDMDASGHFNEKAFWPRSDFEEAFRELINAEEPLILPVMQSILRYLRCDPHQYDERLTATNFGFRLNYYPAPKGNSAGQGGRMLGHEDVDLFTFLPAPSVEGLQVLNRRNMKWIRLHAPPGSIILNTGDYMQRITNDRLPSTTHRVSQPREAAARLRDRISFPLAIYVWEDEMLEVLPGLGAPKYPPVSAISFHTHTTAKYYGAEYAVDGPDADKAK